MVISAGGAASSKQAELDGLRAQIAAIPVVPVVDTSEEDALAAEKGARVGALSAALAGRVAWDRVLRQVSLVLPEDVWLTNLSAAAPDAAQAAPRPAPASRSPAPRTRRTASPGSSPGSQWCPTSRTCGSSRARASS